MKIVHFIVKYIRILSLIAAITFTITSIIVSISLTKNSLWSWENIVQIKDFFNPDRPIPLMIFSWLIAVIFYLIEKSISKYM
jgi:Zn-dependent protease with chaperone function